jgi:hypothetical protein
LTDTRAKLYFFGFFANVSWAVANFTGVNFAFSTTSHNSLADGSVFGFGSMVSVPFLGVGLVVVVVVLGQDETARAERNHHRCRRDPATQHRSEHRKSPYLKRSL